MKHVLVKFENGKFGVRVGRWPFYKFLDLRDKSFRWAPDSGHFCDCMGDEETARTRLYLPYKVIK